jgi:hypothetical protein
VTVVVLAPLVPPFLGIAEAKGGYGGVPTASVTTALRSVLLLQGNPYNVGWLRSDQIIGALSVVATVIVIVRDRLRALPTVLWTVTFLGLYLVSAVNDGPIANLLTGAWYRHPDRVAYNLVLPVVVITATAIGPILQKAGAWVLRSAGPTLVMVALALVLTAVALGPVRSRTSALVPLTTTVTSSEVEAFAFLDRNVSPKGRVLNDPFREGSAWMYTFFGVMPVFQLQPSSELKVAIPGEEPESVWGERIWLAQNIDRSGTDPAVDALVRKYRVEYVYFGERTFFDGANRVMALDRLQNAAGLEPVFERDQVHVFKVIRALPHR